MRSAAAAGQAGIAPPIDQPKPPSAKNRSALGRARRRDRRAAHSGRGAGGWYIRPSARPQREAGASRPFFGRRACPFTNLSGDPSQDYFADGVTENLTTELSRIRDSFVIARNTAFTYKGKSDRRQGDRQGARRSLRARRLGAARPESGAGQRAADRRRIWRGHLGRPVRSGHGGSVQAAGSSGGAIGQRLALRARHGRSGEGVQRAKSGRHRSGDARVGRDAVGRLPSKDQVDAARPLFEQALKIDPDNSEALAGKATTTLFEYIYAPKADTDYDAAILGLVDRAIALDRGNIHAYRTKGQYLGDFRPTRRCGARPRRRACD